MRVKSLDNLSHAVDIPEQKLKCMLARANKRLLLKQSYGRAKSYSSASERRREHWFAPRKGWSLNKGKTMLSECVMSVSDYLFFKDRYFPDEADEHERIKLLEEFKKNHPEFKSR